MAQEVEIKARVVSLDAVRAALRQRGAVLTQERSFEDNFLLDDGAGYLASRGQALRVRQVDGQTLLTFKGPRSVVRGVKSREELEVRCSDGTTLLSLFERLGYRRAFRYQKYRETWRLDEVEVMLDETPIGTFVEIEGAEPVLRVVAEELGLTASIVEQSYASLFRTDLIARGEPPDAMTFSQDGDDDAS